jgi:Tfp pilus assembly protein PilF
MKNKALSFLILPLLFLSAVSAAHAQTVEVLIKNAEAAIEKRDYDAALKALDDALVLEPRSADVVARRALVMVFQDRFKEALTEAEIALELDANSAAAYAARGQAKLGIGGLSPEEEKAALADLTRAVDLAPNDYNSYVSRSEGYFQTRKIQEAEADLTKAIELAPARHDLYYRRGIVRVRLGFGFPAEYDRANEDFSKAISLAPKESEYYARRAVGNWSKLTNNESYPKIKENDPLLKSIGEDLKTALKLNPQNWLALAYRAETLYKTNWSIGKNSDKDRFQAIDDLLASLKINPRDNPARSFLGSITTIDYPADKLAAGLEAALASEKAYFEKNILTLAGTESLATFDLLAGREAFKNIPKYDMTVYLRGLAEANPGNLCYQLHYYARAYNQNFPLLEGKYAEILKKPFEEKYADCAAQMALTLARRYDLNIFNAQSPEAANDNYSSARKWLEKAEEIYPGSSASVAARVEESKRKKDEYLAKNYKPPTPVQTTNSGARPGSGSPEENALISEYNRLVSANIPRLDSQRRSLQSKVSDYMSANKMARVWMHRGVYNYCSSVINSHEAFITSLNNLLKRAYGKSPRLVSEIESQIRSVESGVERLKQIRYGLVNAL